MPDAAAIAAESTRDYAYHDNLPYRLGERIGHRAKIGLIVLAPDWTIENEVTALCQLPGVAVFSNRIPMAPEVKLETLRAMGPNVTACADLLMPGFELDVVAYGCTSGTIAIGKEALFESIRSVRPGVACTTPIVAGVAGWERLGVGRIALMTPYIEEVNVAMRDFVLDHGIEVPVMGTFNNPLDEDVAAIDDQSLFDGIMKLGESNQVEGVFVSCTSLHVTPVIARAEEALGKPVISSNLALSWPSLRLAGVADAVPGYGRLMTL